MILPDIDADFDLYLEQTESMKYFLGVLSDPAKKLNRCTANPHFQSIYFPTLANVLRIINALDVGDREGDIGLQLSTTDDTVQIFPNEIDPQWVSCHFFHIVDKILMNAFSLNQVSTIPNGKAVCS